MSKLSDSDVLLPDEGQDDLLIGEETERITADTYYLVDEAWFDSSNLVDLSKEEHKRHVLQFW